FDDRGAELDVLPGDHADAVGERAPGLLPNGVRRSVVAAAGAVDEDGLSNLQLVAGLENGVVDRPTIDVDAVGAIAVEDAVTTAVETEPQFRVPAGNFGVVQADGVARIAADSERRPGQLELPAFVGAFD